MSWMRCEESAQWLTWSGVQGQGLIELAGASEDPEGVVDSGSEAMVRSDSSSMASTSYDTDNAELPGAKSRRAVSQIKLICIDMDSETICSLNGDIEPMIHSAEHL